MTDFSFKQLKFTKAIYGGMVAMIAIFLGGYLVGNLGKSEALANIKEMRPSLRFVCSAILTATSTILALLLTLLSVSGRMEETEVEVPYLDIDMPNQGEDKRERTAGQYNSKYTYIQRISNIQKKLKGSKKIYG